MNAYATLPSKCKGMVDAFCKATDRLKSLSVEDRTLWWSKNIWSKAAKRFGVQLDKLPVFGPVLAIGGFMYIVPDAYAGEGPYLKGVDGLRGLAANSGLYAAREITYADLWEDIAKSGGEAVIPFAGVPDSIGVRAGRGGLAPFTEEGMQGLNQSRPDPPIRSKKKAGSDRWPGLFEPLNGE